MVDSEIHACRSRESSPSLTNHVPETHVSPPISPNVSGHTHPPLLSEQNGLLSQPSHSRDQTNEARTYLRGFWSDSSCSSAPVEFTIPYLSWSALSNDPELNLHKLKVSYDSLKSILTIFPMEGMRHNHVVKWVNKLATLAEQNFDTSISRKFRSIDNVRLGYSKGEWNGSFRKSDFAIAWQMDGGGTDIHTIVEVGSSQSRNQLREVAKIYLEGAPQTSRVILIDLVETPKYVQPTNLNIDELKNIKSTEFQVDSDQGPVWYKGIRWVGHNTISWEVWERDPKNGNPVQIFETTMVPNDGRSQLPFFEIPSRIADNVKAVTVKPADIDHLWHDLLRDAIIDEGVWRMDEYVRERRKEADEAAKIARQKEEADEKKKKANEERAKRAQRQRGD